jgi:hypothetical protein
VYGTANEPSRGRSPLTRRNLFVLSEPFGPRGTALPKLLYNLPPAGVPPTKWGGDAIAGGMGILELNKPDSVIKLMYLYLILALGWHSLEELALGSEN